MKIEKRPWPAKAEPWLTPAEVKAMMDRVFAPIKKTLSK